MKRPAIGNVWQALTLLFLLAQLAAILLYREAMEVFDVVQISATCGVIAGFIVRGWVERSQERLAYESGRLAGIGQIWPEYVRALFSPYIRAAGNENDVRPRSSGPTVH